MIIFTVLFSPYVLSLSQKRSPLSADSLVHRDLSKNALVNQTLLFRFKSTTSWTQSKGVTMEIFRMEQKTIRGWSYQEHKARVQPWSPECNRRQSEVDLIEATKNKQMFVQEHNDFIIWQHTWWWINHETSNFFWKNVKCGCSTMRN